MKISEMYRSYQWYCPNCHWPNYIDDDCVAVGVSMWCEHCDRYTTVEEEGGTEIIAREYAIGYPPSPEKTLTTKEEV